MKKLALLITLGALSFSTCSYAIAPVSLSPQDKNIQMEILKQLKIQNSKSDEIIKQLKKLNEKKEKEQSLNVEKA